MLILWCWRRQLFRVTMRLLPRCSSSHATATISSTRHMPSCGPVEFATAGIFLAGMAHYPKPIEESIAQAAAAASRAAVTLSKELITVEGVVSNVKEFMCRACGECEKACPFNAIAVGENEEKMLTAVVQEALCKGCGMCAVACPTGAASVHHFDDEVVLTMVEKAFAGVNGNVREDCLDKLQTRKRECPGNLNQK